MFGCVCGLNFQAISFRSSSLYRLNVEWFHLSKIIQLIFCKIRFSGFVDPLVCTAKTITWRQRHQHERETLLSLAKELNHSQLTTVSGCLMDVTSAMKQEDVFMQLRTSKEGRIEQLFLITRWSGIKDQSVVLRMLGQITQLLPRSASENLPCVTLSVNQFDDFADMVSDDYWLLVNEFSHCETL